MPFKKGNSGNINGRRKGVPNKSTAHLRESIQLLLESNMSQIQAVYDVLEPKDKLKFITDLLPFVLPKYQSTQINASIEGPSMLPAVFINGLSVDEIKSKN